MEYRGRAVSAAPEKGDFMIRVHTVLILVLLCATIAVAADGDNKLTNGSFEIDLTGWTPLGDVVFEWNPMDADGSPSSGSGLVTNAANYQSTRCVRQCSDVLEGDMEYRVRAMVNSPSGQTGLGWADIRLDVYPEPNCGGSPLWFESSSPVYSTDPDQWLESWATFTTAPNARSTLVDLCVNKNTASGTLAISFDNVKLFATEIFEGGFEDGTLSGWSVVYE